ncbi:MAG: hypothetical protein NUV98_05450 [Candidatus Roizmanbacteria bacterium]|nr:hypothetical protein [Candidatus Roizmanbacteria bacterium]
MNIDLSPIGLNFEDKPLVVGGKAMEYYGLRKSGLDIDLVVSKRDFRSLLKKDTLSLKDLYADLGIVIDEFEIWKTIYGYDYEYLSRDAISLDTVLMISIEKLLLMKACAVHIEKYRKDTELISKYIQSKHGKTVEYLRTENDSLLHHLSNVTYVEKTG